MIPAGLAAVRRRGDWRERPRLALLALLPPPAGWRGSVTVDVELDELVREVVRVEGPAALLDGQPSSVEALGDEEGREQSGRRKLEGCLGGGGGSVLAVIFVVASFACLLPPNISQTSPKKIAYGTALWILSASVVGVADGRLELLRGGMVATPRRGKKEVVFRNVQFVSSDSIFFYYLISLATFFSL